MPEISNAINLPTPRSKTLNSVTSLLADSLVGAFRTEQIRHRFNPLFIVSAQFSSIGLQFRVVDLIVEKVIFMTRMVNIRNILCALLYFEMDKF